MSTAIGPAHIVVGDRTVSNRNVVADVLADSGITLPGAVALLGNVVAAVLTPPVPAARRVEYHWYSDHDIDSRDVVVTESVVTRVRDGRVERHVRLLDESGTVRESGTETWVLDDSSNAVVTPELDFCSVEWGALLRDSLEADHAFTSALSTWDGTIGLRCSDREVHLRIYKGRIVDVTRRTPHGATFTFVAPAHTWVELALADTRDFMRRAIRGEFASSGDGYEYLRLTKPLDTIIAHARELARKATS